MRAEVVAEGITFTAAENQLDLKYILSVMKAKLKSLFVFLLCVQRPMMELCLFVSP